MGLTVIFRRLDSPRLAVKTPPYCRNPFLRTSDLRLGFDVVRLR